MAEINEKLAELLTSSLYYVNEENYHVFISGGCKEANQLLDIFQQNRKIINKDLLLSKVTLMSLLPFMYTKNSSILNLNLRLLYYYFDSEERWKLIISLRYDIPLVRVLFNSVNLEQECKYAILIISKAVSLCPNLIPSSIIYCLNAIISDSLYQKTIHKDRIVGILCLLAIKCPQSFNGINLPNTLIGYCLCPKNNHFVVDSIMKTLLYLFDEPEHRYNLFKDGIFESLLAPYTDLYYSGSLEPQEINEDYLCKCCKISRVALMIILRSWTGMVAFFSSEHGFRSLLKILPNSPYHIQTFILSILCDLFFIPNPDESKTFNRVILDLDISRPQQFKNQLEKFDLVGEMLHMTIPPRKNGIDMMAIYKAFLIKSCISQGLMQVLFETILLTKEDSIKNSSKLILGELLYSNYSYLPDEIQSKDYMEFMMNDKIYNFKKNPTDIKNIFADISSYQDFKNSFFNSYVSVNFKKYIPIDISMAKKMRISEPQRKKSEEKTTSSIRENSQLNSDIEATRIFAITSESWCWEKIKRIFYEYSPIFIEKTQDSTVSRFMFALKDFYIPSRSNFCFTKINCHITRLASEVAYLFFKTLLHPRQTNEGLNIVNEFLIAMNMILEKHDLSSAASPQGRSQIKFNELYVAMHDSLSVQYFALIGFIQENNVGQMLVDGSHILITIYRILESTDLLLFVKAMIPYMNYSNLVCQKFIGVIISKDNIEIKLYIIKFLRAYSRQHINNEFVIHYLTRLLHDLNESVTEEAADALDEILETDINACEEFIDLNLPLMFFGKNGVKLLSRLATVLSKKSGAFQNISKYFPYLKKQWCSDFLIQYCDNTIIKLNSSLSPPMAETSMNCISFAQISQCYLSTFKIQKFIDIKECVIMLNVTVNKLEIDYDQIRKNILFIANFCSTEKGLKVMEKYDCNILQKLVKLAYQAEKLTIRWISVLALNIICLSNYGKDYIKKLSWVVFNNEPLPWINNPAYIFKPQNFSNRRHVDSLIIDNNEIKSHTTIIYSSHSIENSHKASSSNLSLETSSSNLSLETSPTDKDGQILRSRSLISHNSTKRSQRRSNVHSGFKILEDASPKDKDSDDIFSFSPRLSKSYPPTYSSNENANEGVINYVYAHVDKIIALPVDIRKCFNVAKFDSETQNTERKNNKDRYMHKYLEGELLNKCLTCSIEESNTNEIFEMFKCKKFDNSSFQNRVIIKSMKEDTSKVIATLIHGDTVDDYDIKNEVVDVFFNLITQTMFKNGEKIISELNIKYHDVFSDCCFFMNLVEQSISFKLRPQTCNIIFNSFKCKWMAYFKQAINLLEIVKNSKLTTFFKHINDVIK